MVNWRILLIANEVPIFPLHTHSIAVNDPVANEFISWKDNRDTTIRNSYILLEEVSQSGKVLRSSFWSC